MITNPELVAINQDRLGLQAHVIQHDGEGYVLAKDIEKRYTGPRAVTLYNPSDYALTFTVPAEAVGFTGGMTVRDLNERKDLGTCEVLEMTLPALKSCLL